MVGIRTPTFDLAARKPGFRLRMVKQVPGDEWLAPGLNHGCVLRFNETGDILESYWDPTGISHSTGMRTAWLRPLRNSLACLTLDIGGIP